MPSPTSSASMAPTALPTPTPGAQVIGLASNGVHCLALRNNGTVWAWGANYDGQLGNGISDDIPSFPTPSKIPELDNVTAVAAGFSHSLAIRQDGTVWAWGANTEGQLGDGTQVTRSRPMQVEGLTDVVAVAGGAYRSVALKSDGTVWAWGSAENVDLRADATPVGLLPTQVPGLRDIVAVAAGHVHTLALASNGAVWAWGSNSGGELGDGTTTDLQTPVQTVQLDQVIALAAGGSQSVALKADGTVWQWGLDGTVTPRQIQNLPDIIAISAGYQHVLALQSDGTVWAWGTNGNGELGDGTYSLHTYTYRPSAVVDIKDIVGIAAGGMHSLAFQDDGTVWAWGGNVAGQLGNNEVRRQLTPAPVLFP